MSHLRGFDARNARSVERGNFDFRGSRTWARKTSSSSGHWSMTQPTVMSTGSALRIVARRGRFQTGGRDRPSTHDCTWIVVRYPRSPRLERHQAGRDITALQWLERENRVVMRRRPPRLEPFHAFGILELVQGRLVPSAVQQGGLSGIWKTTSFSKPCSASHLPIIPFIRLLFRAQVLS